MVLVGMQGIFSTPGGSAEPSRTLAAAAAAAVAAQEKDVRVAVVIGNSRYPSGALANPRNDATAMAASLTKLGFDVELKLDASKADMDAVFKRFSSKADAAGVAALFYAGHGIQVSGSNYIVPIDANPKSERDLKREMVKMDDVIDDMGGAKVKLVFFDACRDNPLSRSFGRGGSRGMAAPVEATGTLISFATKHGNTAADGDAEHSPYTTALLAALQTPAGVEIEQMLRKVQQAVKLATNGQQEPWRYGSLDGEFYFQAPAPQVDNLKLQQEAIERSVQEAIKRANDQAINEALRRAAEQQARERDTSALAVEMSYWDSIKASQSADDFKAYVKRYPKGSFVDLAQNRIAALEREANRRGEEARVALKPAAAPAGVDQTAVELAFWDSIKNSSNIDDLKEYLASYPQGRFAGLARNRIRSLETIPSQAAARPVPQAAPDASKAVPQAPAQVAMIAPTKPAPVPAASPGFPRAGDSWTYRYINGWKKDSPQTIVVKVEESDGGRVTDKMSLRGGRGADERTFEGKLEGAERPLGRDVRVIELLPYVQSLLLDGLKPGQERSFPDTSLGGQNFRIKAKLIRQEKVTVPAGTFDAFRVDIVGQDLTMAPPTMGVRNSIVSSFSHVIWFAPEIRRVVKVEHRSRSFSSSRVDDDTLELVASTVAGQALPGGAQVAEIAQQKPALDHTGLLPKAGDSWTYRYINGWKKGSPQTVVVRVEESEGGRVTDRMSMRGGRGVDERTYEGKVDSAERPLGGDVRVIELLPYAQALLQDGLKPGQEKQFPDITLEGQTYRIKAKLIGQEKITVPAGTFDAMRVEIVGQNTGAGVAAAQWSLRGVTAFSFAHALWFAPEIRRVIKVEHKSRSGVNSQLGDDTLELVSFTLR